LDSESAPAEIPRRLKNNLGKQKVIKPPQKRAALKKKVLVEQEKVGHVKLANA
jgi:hypothetical protein